MQARSVQPQDDRWASGRAASTQARGAGEAGGPAHVAKVSGGEGGGRGKDGEGGGDGGNGDDDETVVLLELELELEEESKRESYASSTRSTASARSPPWW